MINQLRKLLAQYMVGWISALWPEGKRKSEVLSACSSLILAMGKDAYEEMTGRDADETFKMSGGTVHVHPKGTQF